MSANGYSAGAITALWEILVPFSDYAFNKSHTAAYGLVSYWTGYLKANYPAEYMAALLTSVRDDKDKSALYLNECRHMGIKVLPPDVNSSIGNFAAVGADIRFGLEAIRNVGRNVVESIVAARRERGAFTSFEDFLRKCPAPVLNKRTVESLIKAGAFDSLGHPRGGLARVYEAYVDALADEKRQEAIGQDSLFADFGFGDDDSDSPGISLVALPAIPDTEWDKQTLLTFERDMLGLYVSDHPLFGIEHILAAHADTAIASLMGDERRRDGETVTVAGLVTAVALKRNKKGDIWAIVTVEDLEGAIECLFFPATYNQVATILTTDIVVAVRGRVNLRDDAISLYAQDLTVPDTSQGERGPVVLAMSVRQATGGRVEELRRILGQHPGGTEVHVRLKQPGREVLMRLEDSYRVTPSPALFGDLKALLGPTCLVG